jgi:hypothetical protein
MRLAACLLAAVAIVLASAPAAGAAGWSRQKIANDAVYYSPPVIGGNERGDAALVFRRDDGLYVAVARPGGDFGRGHRIPGSAFGDPAALRVAVDARGNILVGWTYNDGSKAPRPNARDEGCCRRIRLALLRHGTTRFGVSKTMGRPGFDSALRAMAIVEGRVGVAWDDFDGASAKFSSRALKLGAAVRVPNASPSGSASALAVIPLRVGAILLFRRMSDSFYPDFTVDWSLGEVRIARSTTTRTLFSRHSQFPEIGVAANERGEQALAWSEEVASTGPYDLYAGFRRPGAPFKPRLLSSRNASYQSPRLALASTGAAGLGWDNGKRILAAGRRPGAAFGGIGTFSPSAYVIGPDVAVAPSGRGLITWSSSPPDHVFAAFRTRGGRRIGVHDFGRAPLQIPGAVLDSRGSARVAWMRDTNVWVARGRFPVK